MDERDNEGRVIEAMDWRDVDCLVTDGRAIDERFFKFSDFFLKTDEFRVVMGSSA